MSTKWFDSLGEELKNWNLVGLSPSFDVMASDHVVGTADDELRKLYELSIQYVKSGFESFVATQHAKTKENFEYHAKKSFEFHKKHENLLEFFWISVRDSFDLWVKPLVGVRKDWKVVWSEEDEESESGIEQHKIVIVPMMSMN
jgi:hypothetical protein